MELKLDVPAAKTSEISNHGVWLSLLLTVREDTVSTKSAQKGPISWVGLGENIEGTFWHRPLEVLQHDLLDLLFCAFFFSYEGTYWFYTFWTTSLKVLSLAKVFLKIQLISIEILNQPESTFRKFSQILEL